jgi:hypothetical protein
MELNDTKINASCIPIMALDLLALNSFQLASGIYENQIYLGDISPDDLNDQGKDIYNQFQQHIKDGKYHTILGKSAVEMKTRLYLTRLQRYTYLFH